MYRSFIVCIILGTVYAALDNTFVGRKVIAVQRLFQLLSAIMCLTAYNDILVVFNVLHSAIAVKNPTYHLVRGILWEEGLVNVAYIANTIGRAATTTK